MIPGSPDPEAYAGISRLGVDGASVECVTIWHQHQRFYDADFLSALEPRAPLST